MARVHDAQSRQRIDVSKVSVPHYGGEYPAPLTRTRLRKVSLKAANAAKAFSFILFIYLFLVKKIRSLFACGGYT